jgi:DNA topoisomerase-3
MNLVEKVTTPPTHLTEAELITKMEKHGIGTDGSVPGHVEKLNKRNFVEVCLPLKFLLKIED